MRRTRLTSYEHELGDWMRARRAPDVRLSGLLRDRELPGSFGTYDPYAV